MTTSSTYRLIITPRQPSAERRLTAAAHQLGLTAVQAVWTGRLIFLRGPLTAEQVGRLAAELLVDPVTEQFAVDPPVTAAATGHTVEVTLHPGVTDPAAENLVRAAHLLGAPVEQAATGQQFRIGGALTSQALHRLAEQLLANPVIQHIALDRPAAAPFAVAQSEDDAVEAIALRAADDAALLAISRERRLSLDLAEMRAVQAYYQSEQREPTDVELEMLAQTWSEHCVHKTFRALIDYTGPDGVTETIDGVLKTLIRGATEKINKPWVRSAFVDNAGIIRFDQNFDLAFKVETHNHPSALEPFGGANTGIGGVVRDVLGVSARPIANTDVLCFGLPDTPPDALPAGVLHPARVADGVIHGIEDYGNKMGIPTVNGAIVYHPGYTANPLVYCGCVGLLPHGAHRTGAQPGDLIVAIGGRVGRDGLRGATFSSMEMDETTGATAGSAVQIGHPIMEKQVQEVVLRCRDAGLYNAITDCGAGGFSSAVGEMGEAVGARVQLKRALLKYPGLRPWEIWLSEAQERMVLAVPPANWPQVAAIAAGQDVEAVVLGEFEPTGRLRIFYGDRLVGDVAMAFLHDGLPRRRLTAVWDHPRPSAPPPGDLIPPQEALLRLLAHPSIRSKEGVVRRYDHEVQTGTAVKPFVGVADHGPGDATVLAPLDAIDPTASAVRGFALANGICPTYGELDPYAMAWAAIDEALRNLTAVGANPDEVAILDNFCWGNPNLPDRLGALVRCAQGCHDAAVAYRAPFISGKDSLNNEYTAADGTKHAIPGTLLISAVGMVPDVHQTVTMDWKQPGNLLFTLGETRAEMGGSAYALLHGETGGAPPQPLLEGLARCRALHRAIRQGLVAACHDLSEGGLGVALAEMAIAGRLGATVDLKALPANAAHDAVLLFAESNGRFLVEVAPEHAQAFRFAVAADKPAEIGAVNASGRLVVRGYAGDVVIDHAVADLERAWRGDVAPTPLPRQSRPTNAAPQRAPAVHGSKRVLIVHANGANRDRDAALACQLAGGAPEIVHINQLLSGARRLADYHMLVIPGGFSYGDDLGAGVLLAVDLRRRLGEQLQAFVASGRPTLGICNGFQALVKAGLFGLQAADGASRGVTLTYNADGHFTCRWVTLLPNPRSACLFTRGLEEPLVCPVAHGEGRFLTADDATAARLQTENLIALTYAAEDGASDNPNGSLLDIAGIGNPAGNLLGLMPHPENHIFPWQHPRRHRGEHGGDGLRLFVNGLRAA